MLYTYLNTQNPSKKTLKAVRRIAAELRIKRRDPGFKDKNNFFCDTLKQKIEALGIRMRRYNERVKRYKNNRQFFQDRGRFFRGLEQDGYQGNERLDPGTAHKFWSGVWSEKCVHDERAYWIGEAQAGMPQTQMEEVNITESDIAEVLRKANNWASPGSDKVHNYWWKYFTNVHTTLATLFQKSLSDPSIIPESFTLGVTHLIPKDGDRKNPQNYRPITCLPAVYKILTAVITRHINKHLRDNNLMAEEQNGCRINTKGCKELLVVDYILTKQARKKLRNISIAWIDYRKAFDSVPHTWLVKVLELHGISGPVVNLLKYLMTTWRTSLLLWSESGAVESEEIWIRRGIFQGDTLSPIWFCMALNLLSRLLNNTKYGYIIDKQRNLRISHHLYMDDLKLYASSPDQLRRLLEIVAAFSDSIKMQMGVDKCAMLDVRRGKIQNTEDGVTLMNATNIPALNANDSYKYLGINQALEIKISEMKKIFKEKLYKRVNVLLKTKLNSKSLFTAINTWAIPCLTYSFGILTWSQTDLREIDRTIRTILTKYGVHHPHSSTIRLYLPRQHGGRGLINLETTHGKNINSLREYFLSKNSPLFRAIREADSNISALKLSNSDHREAVRTLDELVDEWSSKPLHGRYPGHLKSKNINKSESLTYLRAGYLFPETEGRLMAIQDQVMPTRMYLKHITKQNIPSDRCRKCSQAQESIQHVTSSCTILASRDYLDRHNAMGKIYHQQLALKLGLIQNEEQQHLYQPKTLLQNQRYKLYWDATLITDRGVAHNRPDVALFDMERETCLLLDFTIPADDNLTRAYTEKLSKYADLAFQLRELYKLKSISILPLIISVNGLVEEHLIGNTDRLCLPREVISSSQKQVILSTTRIVRKFLQES